MLTRTPLRRTLSNTTASKCSENRSSPGIRMQREHTYIYDGVSHKESIFSLALQVLYIYVLFVMNQRINTMHLIMVPQFKLFSTCGVTDYPPSSAICRAPGLAQACPHDAMHLPSNRNNSDGRTPDWCTVRSVVQHRILAKYPSPCWVGSGGAGCARTQVCSESGCGCGCQSPWPSIDPLDGLRRTHAQQEQRTLGLHFSGDLKDNCPRTYPFGHCRCEGIQHTGCCTPLLFCGWLVLNPWVAQAPASVVLRNRVQILQVHDSLLFCDWRQLIDTPVTVWQALKR